MSEPRRNWTEPEIERAIDLYLITPFGRLHSRNPDIMRLADEIGRTPGSVALKLTNLASIDANLDRKGMSNASKLDRLVWGRFFDQLQKISIGFEANPPQIPLRELGEEHQLPYAPDSQAGTVTQRITNARVGQEYFRQIILASYEQRCAVTGISQPELLVAGHIRPWAIDPENRMNPRNGICLNRLHDKAFEERLITIETDGRILYSKRLRPETKKKMAMMSDTGNFRFPSRLKPDLDFLAEHRDRFLLEQ